MPLSQEHSWKYWYSLISLQQVPLPEPPSHCACGRDRRRRPRMTPCTYLAKKFPLRCNSCCFYCLCHWRCSCCCCFYYYCCWWPKMIPGSLYNKEFPLKFVLQPQVCCCPACWWCCLCCYDFSLCCVRQAKLIRWVLGSVYEKKKYFHFSLFSGQRGSTSSPESFSR